MNGIVVDPTRYSNYFSLPIRQSLLNWLDAFSRARISSKSPNADLNNVTTYIQSFFSDLTVQTKNQFTALVAVAKAVPTSFLAIALAGRPNLKAELGDEEFKDLMAAWVKEAKKDPKSPLAVALAGRPNLKAELGDEEFKDLMAAWVKEANKRSPRNSGLVIALAGRENLKAELGDEEFNSWVNMVRPAQKLALFQRPIDPLSSDLAIAFARRPNLKAELGDEEFKDLMAAWVKVAVGYTYYSGLAIALAERPNLQEELGEDKFKEFMGALVAAAKADPNSPLAVALAGRPNLQQELGEAKFKEFMGALVAAAKTPLPPRVIASAGVDIDHIFKCEDQYSGLARALAARPNLQEELGDKEFKEFMGVLVTAATNAPFSLLAAVLVRRQNLKEELGDKEFKEFMGEMLTAAKGTTDSFFVQEVIHRQNNPVQAFNKNPYLNLAKALAGRPNLQAELGSEVFTTLVKNAKANPQSLLAIALAQRPNLQEELGKDMFNEFMGALLAAAQEKPDSGLAIALAERPNLKAELKDLVAIPNIAPGFDTEFNNLNLPVQGQFGTWLDTVFTKVLPEDISTDIKTQIRRDALAYFPQAIRAKIQAGLNGSL
jgi:hypothetical protein